jgi:hypothetical protein
MSLSLYALTLAPVSVALTGIRGTSGSNPPSSSSQSVSAVNPEAVTEKPRTLATVWVRLGT